MGKLYDQIDADLQVFIEAQRVFFVATAPIDASTVSLRSSGRCRLKCEERIERWRTRHAAHGYWVGALTRVARKAHR